MALSADEQRKLADRLARATAEAAHAEELLNQARRSGVKLQERELELLSAKAEKARLIYQEDLAYGRSAASVQAAQREEWKNLEEQYDKASEKAREYSGAVQGITNNVRGMLGITSQWRSNTVAALVGATFSSKGLIQTLREVRQEFQKNVTAADLAGSAAMKVTETLNAGWLAVVASTLKLAGGLDSATVAMNRATGAAPVFGREIERLESTMTAFGVNAARAGSAIQALYSGASAYTEMSSSMREQVAQSTALLDRLGISSETSARNIDIMTRSMGMTGTQAAATNEQLFATAQQFNISTTRMLEGFSSVAPEMMKFGSNAVNVYTRLQVVAKQTGIEVGRLLSIVSRFDRFDTAADAVGGLNAVLGGPFLHAMQMVQVTDPTQRLVLMSQAVRDAGLSFESMGYYMRQTLANRMGLADVNELALVMRGNFTSVNGAIQSTSKEARELRSQTERYNTVQEEFAQVARQLAVALYPLVPVLKSIAQFLQENAFIVKAFIPAIIGLKVGMVAISGATMIWAGGLGTLAASIGPVIAIVGALALGIGALTATQGGLAGVTSGINQIAASVSAVPEAKTTKFTQLVEKVDQLSGRTAAGGAAATQGLAMSAVGGGRGGVITKVTQPINVDLSIGEEHIQRRIVNTFHEFRS